MALKLFEFLEQIMNGTFSINLTQFEKTGLTGIFFISLGNLKIKFQFYTFLSDSGVCLTFNKENSLNLKRKSKSNRKKNYSF